MMYEMSVSDTISMAFVNWMCFQFIPPKLLVLLTDHIYFVELTVHINLCLKEMIELAVNMH